MFSHLVSELGFNFRHNKTGPIIIAIAAKSEVECQADSQWQHDMRVGRERMSLLEWWKETERRRLKG